MKKILLTFLLAVMAITGQALEFSVGSLKYYIETNGDAYCNGLAATAGNPTSITIPGRVTYNGTTYYVTSIATNAFKNNTTLQQVRVGWGVQQIGSASFMGCTALQYVWLPSSVTTMYNQAFQNCTSMRQFQIAAPTPPVLYGDKTFYNMRKCDVVVAMRSSITDYSNSSQFVDADSNGSIGANGYAANDFINNGVAWVITNENIKDINVNVTMVGISPSLTYLPMASSTTDYTNATYGNGSSMNCNWTHIAPYAANGNTSLQTIGRSDLGSYFRLQEVGAYAFENCTALTQVNISAVQIGEHAFYNCSRLATVNLYLKDTESYGTQKLGTLCFAKTAVTNQYIPSSLTTYGYGAFANCSNLRTFSIGSNSNFSLFGKQGYYGLCSSSSSGTRTLYQHPNAPFYGDEGKDLRIINPYAFAGVQYSVELPPGVTTIGSYAFYNAECPTILIPSTVTSFQSTSFSYMKVNRLIFNKTTIPSSLTYSYTFSGVTNTSGGTSIRLSVPSGYSNKFRTTSPWSSTFTTIDEKAYDEEIMTLNGEHTNFYITVTSTSSYVDPLDPSHTYYGQCKLVRGDMTNRTGYLTIPNSWSNKNNSSGMSHAITEIDREAFRDMTGITKVQGGNYIKKIGALAFAGLTGCTVGFDIPNPVEFGDSSLFNCKTPTITLGNRLTTIGKDAFRYSNVRQVLMPPSVTSIGSRFLAGATNLDTLRLSPNITDIPMHGLGWISARYIVIPYGVKTIGKAAFFSDKAQIGGGEYLYEISRENVVVIPSSVTYIDPDAFTYARHLDDIYLNCPYGVFTTTSKYNWQRRTDYNGDNVYNWSGHKLYVPVGQVQQYRNDPGIAAAWNENSDIGPGAFDFTNENNFVGTNYRMSVVNPTLKTAKYVYGEGNTGNAIVLSNGGTDHNTGITYTMVEIGDSAFVKHTAATHIYLDDATELMRIGNHAFRGLTALNQEVNVPSGVQVIGQYAFYGCNNLPSVFLNRSSSTTSIGTYMFSTSQQSILYVPLNRMYSIAQQCPWLANYASNRRLLPYVKPTTEWSAISVPVSDNILLPASGEFYYASSFNISNYSFGKTRLSNSQGIKGGEGMLMKGTVGTVYRFRRNDAVSNYSYVSPTSNYLQGVSEAYSTTLTYSSSGPYYYTFDGEKFNRVNSSATVYSGEAYAQMGNSYSNIYIDSDITTYNLWINGTQVTSDNYSNLKLIRGVSGTTVSYNPTSKTLTLNGATITNNTDPGIRSEISGLTIKVIGTNNVTVTAGNHYAVQFMQNATITGTGTLNAGSTAGTGCFVYTGKTLNINGGVQVKFVGSIYGIIGYSTSSRLIISGASTKLTARGINQGSYYQLPTTMNDGLAITSPAGAYFNNGTVVYNGSVAKNIDVVISKPAVTRGDVNGDSSVNISDVTTLIDYLLTGNASGINLSGADANQDSSINISDVTALIDYLLSGSW